MRDTNLAIIKDIADRALGKSTQPESLTDGVSSDIYKIIFAAEVAYLKLSATEQKSLFPEYLVYQWLSAIGVKAPRVLYYSDEDPTLRRSVLIISRIHGRPIAAHPKSQQKDTSLAEAGYELAKINALRIEQYGFVNFSKGVKTLQGNCGSLADFVLGGTVEGLNYLYEFDLISTDTRAKCLMLLEQAEPYLAADYPHLLHGDFGGRHIYFDGNRYTGLIDFGNLRGGSRYHDLAQLRAFDGQLFRSVLTGYQAYTKLPEDAERIIAFEAMALLLSKVNWISQHKPEWLNRYRWVGYYLDQEATFIKL